MNILIYTNILTLINDILYILCISVYTQVIYFQEKILFYFIRLGV